MKPFLSSFSPSSPRSDYPCVWVDSCVIFVLLEGVSLCSRSPLLPSLLLPRSYHRLRCVLFFLFTIFSQLFRLFLSLSTTMARAEGCERKTDDENSRASVCVCVLVFETEWGILRTIKIMERRYIHSTRIIRSTWLFNINNETTAPHLRSIVSKLVFFLCHPPLPYFYPHLSFFHFFLTLYFVRNHPSHSVEPPYLCIYFLLVPLPLSACPSSFSLALSL